VRAQDRVKVPNLLCVLEIAKVLQEAGQRSEDMRLDEVEEGPELFGVVLQRRPGEDYAVICLEELEPLEQLRPLVLQAMRLVDNQRFPVDLTQLRPVRAQNHLVGRKQDVEFELAGGSLLPLPLVVPLVLANDSPVGRVTLVDYTVHLRPAFKFTNPMGKRRQRTHDQERPMDVLITVQILQEGDALNSLAQAHFVRKNRASPVIPAVHEPIEPFQLVLA